MGESRKHPKLSPAIHNELGKDLRKHEKLLENRWNLKWGHLMPEKSKVSLQEQHKDCKPGPPFADPGADKGLHAGKISSGNSNYPKTSAEIVGWKSAHGNESLEKFSTTTKRMPPRICLVEEIYGVYRSQRLVKITSPDRKQFTWVKQERIIQPILS